MAHEWLKWLTGEKESDLQRGHKRAKGVNAKDGFTVQDAPFNESTPKPKIRKRFASALMEMTQE